VERLRPSSLRDRRTILFAFGAWPWQATWLKTCSGPVSLEGTSETWLGGTRDFPRLGRRSKREKGT
jgi:hypothetical protein